MVRFKSGSALIISCIILNLIFLTESIHATSDNNGIIISATGNVTLCKDSGRIKAEEGLSIQTGDTIKLSEESFCEGVTPGGESFKLQGPEHVIIQYQPGKEDKNSIFKWFRRQLNDWMHPASKSAFISRSDMEMEFKLAVPIPLIPSANGRVRPDQSTFVWTLVNGVESYRVTILGDNGEDMLYKVRGNSLVLKELDQGKTYAWKVEPDIEGWSVSSNWRKFKVMTKDEEKNVDAIIEGISDLEAAVKLLIIGLHGEALNYLDRAVEDRKYRGSALKWRAETYAGMGFYRKAYRDLATSNKWKVK